MLQREAVSLHAHRTLVILVAALAALSLVQVVPANHTQCPEDNPDLCWNPQMVQREYQMIWNWYAMTTGSQLNGPRIVSPPSHTSVDVEGSVHVTVFHPDPMVQAVELYAGPMGAPLQLVARDSSPVAGTEVPSCPAPNACEKRGYFEFDWDVGAEAQGYVVDARAIYPAGPPRPFAQAVYSPDIAPEIVLPMNDQVVGPVGKLVASVDAPSTVSLSWGYYSLPLYPLGTVGLLDGSKGLPKKDQHKEGDALSGDTNGDGSKGDMSCAPTSAASSLAWFAKSYPAKYGGLLEWTGPGGPTGGGAMTNKDLVNIIGLLAKTNNAGTVPADLVNAIQTWVDYKLGAGKMKATLVEGTVNLGEVAKEYDRGQDVLLGFYWNNGGAHRVAVNNVVKNADGSLTVTIMDPWNGTYQPVRIGADGKTDYGGGATVSRMIHVSPVEAAPKPVMAIPSLAPYVPGSPLGGTLWPTPGNGDFMVVAAGANAGGNAGFAHAIVHVDQSQPDP